MCLDAVQRDCAVVRFLIFIAALPSRRLSVSHSPQMVWILTASYVSGAFEPLPDLQLFFTPCFQQCSYAPPCLPDSRAPSSHACPAFPAARLPSLWCWVCTRYATATMCLHLDSFFIAHRPTSVLYVFLCSRIGQSLFRVECQLVGSLSLCASSFLS